MPSRSEFEGPVQERRLAKLPQFKNQGRCIAFVNHEPLTSALEAAGLSE